MGGLRLWCHKTVAGPLGGPIFETAVLLQIVKAFVNRGEERSTLNIVAGYELSNHEEQDWPTDKRRHEENARDQKTLRRAENQGEPDFAGN